MDMVGRAFVYADKYTQLLSMKCHEIRQCLARHTLLNVT